ncbi:hypothetical protein [Desulfobacterium sp. N47]|uniref:hypothetical protein n=1 Tax=Desulfobacterium sp. N47 TaxID=3115210 RepID=UPI003F49F1FF
MMNKHNMISKYDSVTSLLSAVSGFEMLCGIEAKNEICPFCDGKHTTLPIEEIIAVGFGNALLTKNNECIYSEMEARSCSEYMTVAQAEELAATDPKHDWRIHLLAPFSERHYQRQGQRHWVLYEKGEGFA